MYYGLWLGSGIRPPRTIPLGPVVAVVLYRHLQGQHLVERLGGTGLIQFVGDGVQAIRYPYLHIA